MTCKLSEKKQMFFFLANAKQRFCNALPDAFFLHDVLYDAGSKSTIACIFPGREKKAMKKNRPARPGLDRSYFDLPPHPGFQWHIKVYSFSLGFPSLRNAILIFLWGLNPGWGGFDPRVIPPHSETGTFGQMYPNKSLPVGLLRSSVASQQSTLWSQTVKRSNYAISTTLKHGKKKKTPCCKGSWPGIFCIINMTSLYTKWFNSSPFDSLVGGHGTCEGVTFWLTIPKRSQTRRIAW